MSKKITPKGITFQPCDEQLVNEIIAYQNANGLPTFISAVRQLCNIAIKTEEKNNVDLRSKK